MLPSAKGDLAHVHQTGGEAVNLLPDVSREAEVLHMVEDPADTIRRCRLGTAKHREAQA